MEAVPLEELRALFTGVPGEDNDWSTTPSYSAKLAFELARRCDAKTEFTLRTILYDKTLCDDIPVRALHAIQLGVQQYAAYRQVQLARRGL